MSKKTIVLCSSILLTLLLAGCIPYVMAPQNPPSPATQNQQDVQATVAAGAKGTLDAIFTKTALAMPSATGTPIATQPVPTEPAPTQAPPSQPAPTQPPADTPVPPATATLAPPPTQAVAMVHVMKDTNCRKGPKIIYDYLGAVMVGEQAELVGRLANNSWWVVNNLDRPGHCWITSQYATPEGPYEQLPIMTAPPPPTPTPYPALEMGFVSKTSCGSDTYYVFSVKNAGTVKFESAQISLTNQTLKQSVGYSSNAPFWPQAASCGNGAGSLGAGKSAYVAIKYGSGANGNAMNAGVTTCTQDDNKGFCVSQGINFTSP